MIDNAIALVMTPQGSTTGGASVGVAPSATSSDVARFQAALTAPGDAPTANDNPVVRFGPAVIADPAAQAPAVPRTLGGTILDGLQSASSDLSARWQEAAQGLAAPMPTTADLLRLQMTVAQASFQYDLLGKLVSKAASNLEQIVKTQ